MAATDPSPLKYAIADYDTLNTVFTPFALEGADQLISFISWRPEWSEPKGKWLKRPIQHINNPLTHMTLNKASKTSQYVGLVCNDLHQIIALDIDGVDPSTPQVNDLLLAHPTYIEMSPSGEQHHLRVLYVLKDEKTTLKRKATFSPPDQEADLELYNMSTNFVTLTGKHHKSTPLEIASITTEELLTYFPTFTAKTAAIVNISTKQQEPVPHQQSTAILTPFGTWLNEVPCDRSDPALMSFMGKHSLIYHDYWLLGLMAIHAAFGTMQGYTVADSWSHNSNEDYDQEELLSRWDTISAPDYTPDVRGLPQAVSSVTAGTYQWMFNEFSIQWPVLKGKSNVPKPDELENFQAFLDYKGITPKVDSLTDVMYLDGADYAVFPTYYLDKKASYKVRSDSDADRLAAILVQEAQPYKFRPTSGQVYNWLKELCLLKDAKVNRFAQEVTSLPMYDPDTEIDYIKLFGTDIIQRNVETEYPSQEFHELLVRKWLLSLGRALWVDNSDDNMIATSEGVLILSSPLGGINKSSFGVRLFPPEWRHLHITTRPRFSGQFEDKDSIQKTISKLVVDFDEAETVFSHNDTAELKAYLTKQFDTLRKPYDRGMKDYYRAFSCLATTNLTDLVFPKEGARRYWWLNVSYVDSYAMDDMNMYNLWRQIKWELGRHTGKRAAYILSPTETKYLESYLVDHTTTNNVEDVLMDIYDFSPTGFKKYTSPGRLKGISELSSSVTEIDNYVLMHTTKPIGHKALKHAVTSLLKQHCPTFHVSSKEVKYGYRKFRGQHRFFMPDPRSINVEDLDD